MASKTRLSLNTVLLFTAIVLVISAGVYAGEFVGGVYVMTNDFESNSIIEYGRRSNGTLMRLGSVSTGGEGAALDEGDGIDPLFSAFSVIPVRRNRFLVAVNAGCSSVSVFRIGRNFRLTLRTERHIRGVGPNSLAFYEGILYVATVEAGETITDDSMFFGPRGSLVGFKLTGSGRLKRLSRSRRRLSNRPSAIQFTPDGRSLVVSSVAAGSTQLDTSDVDEISVFRVFANGRLSRSPIDTATSTLPNNAEGRSLPNAIGLETVKVGNTQYVIVAEPRSLGPDGTNPLQQVSSISTWRITSRQRLVPVQLDLLVGSSLEDGQLATCWVEFSKNKEYFWVANTVSGTISAFSFNDGRATLVEEVAGNSPLPIDLWTSADGKFLYQLSNGAVDAFEIANGGLGAGLESIQTVTDIPEENVQGIVAI